MRTNNYPNGMTEVDVPFKSLGQILAARAASEPDRVAFHLKHFQDSTDGTLTYGELDRRARQVAVLLRARLCQADRVVLMLPPGPDFVCAIFGCIYALVYPVPTPPIRGDHTKKGYSRLRQIMLSAEPKGILASSASRHLLCDYLATIPGGEQIHLFSPEQASCAELDFSPVGDLPGRVDDSSATAFLQYTSGSTSEPKGVIVSHRSLMENLQHIQTSFQLNSASRGVIWLPPYHDMGLIGGIFVPIYTGFPTLLMPPLSFMRRPRTWLEEITGFEATVSGGPNFAYDLCLSRMASDPTPKLDLRSWKVAFNGAEPISVATLENFYHAFAPCGFHREAFFCCYGLAEATLMVTAEHLGDGSVLAVDREALAEGRADPSSTDARSRRIVSCGVPQEVVVVTDPVTRQPKADGEIGEIWLAGTSVASGYWNAPEMSMQTFGATRAGDETTCFLKTGDTGFINQRRLFVTGRLKEVIVVRGKKYYPQDIERSVETAFAGLRNGACAAFQLYDIDSQPVILLAEVDTKAVRQPELVGMVADIRTRILEENQLRIDRVVFIRRGKLPKTPSGKLERGTCRELFQRGEFSVIFDEAAKPDTRTDEPTVENASGLRSHVRSILMKHLRITAQELRDEARLIDLGADSLILTALLNDLDSQLSIELARDIEWDRATIRQILDATELGRKSSASHIPPVISTSGEIPLSAGQRSILFLQRLMPSSTAYHIPILLCFSQNVRLGLFKEAVEQVIKCHPLLRSHLKDSLDLPTFSIHSDEALVWEFYKVRTEDVSQSEELRAFLWKPFDLKTSTPFRMGLFETSGKGIAAALVFHHAVVDLLSLEIIFAQVRQYYIERSSGRPADLIKATHSYADYVRWQDELCASAVSDAVKAYWKERLAGEVSLVPLVPDFSTDSSLKGRAEVVISKVPFDLSSLIFKRATEAGLTPFTFLLGLFFTFLSRYSGQRKLAVACPFAGRTKKAFESIVGYFVNPLLVTMEVKPDSRLASFLEEVRRTVNELQQFQDYPFVRVVEDMGLKRDFSQPSIFQLMFVYTRSRVFASEFAAFYNGESPVFHWNDTEVTPLAQQPPHAQCDLSLSVIEGDQSFLLRWVYDPSVFREETVSDMAQSFLTLLRSAVCGSDLRLEELDLLTSEDRAKRLVLWNATRDPEYCGRFVSDLFVAQVQQSPVALAVSDGRYCLNYQSLDWESNALANLLFSREVRAERVVGVLMDRSTLLLVSLLAILKSGGAFLPLDPTWPQERLRLICDEAKPTLIITQSEFEARAHKLGCSVVCLPGIDRIRTEPVSLRFNARLAPDNAAYVLYTSGSTGRPKGVINTHQGMANRLLWMQRQYGLTSTDRVLQKTPFTFDVSVWELFWPIIAGGSVVFLDPGLHRDCRAIAEAIRREQITTVHFVPSMLEVFLAQIEKGECPTLRRIISSGEALPSSVVAHCFEKIDANLHNLYGPTECSIDVTFWDCREESPRAGVVPIGRPISNIETYILDPGLHPVPLQVTGQIYLGGIGLARGYLDRPEITADRFVPHPFKTDGSRLFSTGDLGRYLSNGVIEYCGRQDDQVKIRGCRVEPAEIQFHLRQHASVRESFILQVGQNGREQTLVAFVIPRSPGADLGELRAFLKARLPDVMIPSKFISIDQIPVTANGKADRTALAKMAEASHRPTRSMEPMSPIEMVLFNIWSEILGTADIRPDDNFFELGGHSLQMARILNRVGSALHCEMSLKTFAERPTIRELAMAVLSLKLTKLQPATLDALLIETCQTEEKAQYT